MVSSGKAKRLRREAKMRQQKRRAYIIDQIENTSMEGWSDQKVRDWLTKWMRDPDGFDYMLGSAIRNNNDGMVEVLRNFKVNGKLGPEFTISRNKDGSLVNINDDKPKKEEEARPIEQFDEI